MVDLCLAYAIGSVSNMMEFRLRMVIYIHLDPVLRIR